MTKKPLIGFIGQGYIGKNYADDFERRGYTVIRYAMEEPFRNNKDRIKDCDIVFIAVPTPTTPKGFDNSILKGVLPVVGDGKIAVIKSTMVPGTTKMLQGLFPQKIVLHSPEFLSEATAAKEASAPFSNIVGIPEDGQRFEQAAALVHGALPPAPFSLTCKSDEAEIIKYTHNASGYVQIIFFNLMYDLAQSLGARWEVIESAVKADPYIPNRYAHPVHKSGRGAGGHCFIKDFKALQETYAKIVADKLGLEVFRAMEKKNLDLLLKSTKDIDLLRGVYGDQPLQKGSKKIKSATKASRSGKAQRKGVRR